MQEDPSRVWTCDELIEALWPNPDDEPGMPGDVLRRHIVDVRTILRTPVYNLRGVGYSLQPHNTLLTRKQQELLDLLVEARGRSLTQEYLYEQLWPHLGNEKARLQLHSYVSRIRRVLGRETVTTTEVGYKVGETVGD
jgi:DNA-binding response OmpR family regulator